MQKITVGKLAQLAGIGVETVRFYEQTGLLAADLKAKNGAPRVSEKLAAKDDLPR